MDLPSITVCLYLYPSQEQLIFFKPQINTDVYLQNKQLCSLYPKTRVLHPTFLLQRHTHQKIKTESSPKKNNQKTHNIFLNKVRTTIILASCLCEPSSYNPLKINFQQSSDKQTDVSVSHRYKHSHGPSTPLNLHHIKLSNGGRETSEK